MMSDLHVERLSDALVGTKLDVVVSGSIAAVESVRFIRSLRRRGAQVTPWLTSGGSQFVTPMALTWAAAQETVVGFSGTASHLALADGCVVAPASANFIAGLAHGETYSPALALSASYLGVGRPLMLMANMHGSLASSPAIVHNIEVVRRFGAVLLASRQEEGKQKFPDPDVLADEVAHRINRQKERASQGRGSTVLITLGTTRGYIDDVRYLSNYSSGRLGSLIAEELYRLGFSTDVVAGPCQYRPRVATQLTQVTTNEEMDLAVKQSLRSGAAAMVMAASVLDFVPQSKALGKLSSADHPELSLSLKRTDKIIADASPSTGIKVGFKLETQLTRERTLALAETYMDRYGLSLLVVNDLAHVDEDHHRAVVFERPLAHNHGQRKELEVLSKAELAHVVARHVAARLIGDS